MDKASEAESSGRVGIPLPLRCDAKPVRRGGPSELADSRIPCGVSFPFLFSNVTFSLFLVVDSFHV